MVALIRALSAVMGAIDIAIDVAIDVAIARLRQLAAVHGDLLVEWRQFQLQGKTRLHLCQCIDRA